MRIARLLLAASTAAFTLTTTAEGQNRRPLPTARDEAARLRVAVEASGNRTAEAFSRGDITGFIQPYAADVWVFPPNAQPFQGPAAAHEYFTRDYTEGTRNLQLTTTGLDRQGSMAYETGTYTADYPTPGRAGATSRDVGKYVHVWKRDPEGAWRIHFAAWSSNLPPPQMPR
jgi:ketosteroid isomerase-like protein